MINPKKKKTERPCSGQYSIWWIQIRIITLNDNAICMCVWTCICVHDCREKINDLCMDLAYSGPIWTWLDLRTGLIITKHGVELLGHPNEGGTTTQLFQLSSTHICAGGTNSTQHISHRHLHRPFVRHFNGFTLWCPENTIMTANINDLKIVLNQNTWF